jgi:hypothetical protein
MRKKCLLVAAAIFAASLIISAPAVASDSGSESTGADQVANNSAFYGVDAGSVSFPTSSETASASILHCTGYKVRVSITRNGHTLDTRGNVCGAFYEQSAGQFKWGPVVRWKCYRDGVLFGSGTGGCRWKGSISSYKNGGHSYSSAYQVPPSSNSAFWEDSGRIFGGAKWYTAADSLKMCQDDWIYDNYGFEVGNGVVHFMGITGIDYGTYALPDHCTGSFNANPA